MSASASTYTLENLRALAELMPADAALTIPSRDLRAALASLPEAAPAVAAPDATALAGWRSWLWNCPAETRLGVAELAEAVGRPKSWVYRHTSERAALSDQLPFRKFDGELVFVAHEIRAWLREHEEVVQPSPSRRNG